MIETDKPEHNRKLNDETVEIVIFLLALFFVYLTSFYRYLLFHSIAELFSIVIAGGIFLVGWNSRRYTTNSFFLNLGISSLFIAGIDLIHTLSYTGMQIFLEFDSNLPTSLWIAARYLQAFAFLLSSFLIRRSIKPRYLLSLYFTITILLFVLIFNQLFPVCYIENYGLTPFKIISEYLINVILIISLVVIIRNRIQFDRKVLILIISSVVSTMIAELNFTFYIGVYDFSNLLGHLFKIIAFYLLYKAIIQIGIENPFELLFRRISNLSRFPSENPNPVLRVDSNQIIYTNKTGEMLFHVEEKSPLPKMLEESVNKALVDNKTQELELKLNSKTYTLAITPVKEMNYVNVYGMDITDRKKAEERLSQLISTVSHELRTPITVLLMSIDYLTNHRDVLDVVLEKKLMDGISRNIQLLNELAEDILLLSRIDENRLPLKSKQYSPLEIINEILYLMGPIGKEKNIVFEVDIDENIRLEGDPKRIDQIFRIIIDNAIKYSNENSKVEIKALKNYKGKYNTDDNPGILFQFKDYGRGVPEEDLPYIFDRFFRCSNVNEVRGTGLGLSIAKDLIEAHNGQIFVESELGKGTTFHLFFPQ
ncbi:MAG: MASE3 domain-containing protein [Promethearchaeota archaeon]